MEELELNETPEDIKKLSFAKFNARAKKLYLTSIRNHKHYPSILKNNLYVETQARVKELVKLIGLSYPDWSNSALLPARQRH